MSEKFNFQNLRIRAYLQTPVISDQFLPLDGVLFFHTVRDRMGEQSISLPSQSVLPKSAFESTGEMINLPFRKANSGSEAWFYKCSFAQWADTVAHEQASYAKRLDLKLAHLTNDRKNINTSSGRYKAGFFKEYYRHALYIDWYADADRAALERILPFCTHLGKKTAQGWGSVLRWQIDDWHSDWSVRGYDNKLMRAVPADGSPLVYGIRPSYHLNRHQFRCLLPE